MSNRKVLITTPRLDKPGGVSSLMRLLQLDDMKDVSYFEVQSRWSSIWKLFYFVFMVPQFFFKVLSNDCVHFNPSMNRNGFWRDGLLLILVKFLGKRTVVYWHGWDKGFSSVLKTNGLLKWYFNLSFKRADVSLVLGQEFKSELVSFGVDEIKVLLSGNAAAPPNFLIPQRRFDELRVLFLSRIESGKGLELVLKTMSILQERISVHLSIAGDGALSDSMKKLSHDLKLKNVHFYGHIEGGMKQELLSNSHLLFQPSESEGMPLSIVESMFFRLLIAAKPVGGIPDWVNDKHALLLNEDNPFVWAEAIENRFSDPTRWDADTSFQSEFASAHLSPAVLRERLLTLYQA